MHTNSLQIPGLLTLSGLNCVCLGKPSMPLSYFTRAEKFRRQMNFLIKHALNKSKSDCAKSEIIFESEDADEDKYILKVTDAGYALTVHTQMQNFASELTVHAKVFEHNFFLKTGYKLEVRVGLLNRSML